MVLFDDDQDFSEIIEDRGPESWTARWEVSNLGPKIYKESSTMTKRFLRMLWQASGQKYEMKIQKVFGPIVVVVACIALRYIS